MGHPAPWGTEVGDLVHALDALLRANPDERAVTSQLCWL
jgi:hypothetical protein